MQSRQLIPMRRFFPPLPTHTFKTEAPGVDVTEDGYIYHVVKFNTFFVDLHILKGPLFQCQGWRLGRQMSAMN